MPTIVYVLELEGDHYYVGKTDDFDERIKRHESGTGSAFTKKYKVVRVIEKIENPGPFDEDNITKEYMRKKGIDNVRGGAYTQLFLTKEQKQFLISEQRSAENTCQRCGRAGHFIARCSYKIDIDGKFIPPKIKKIKKEVLVAEDEPPNIASKAPMPKEKLAKNKPYKRTKICAKCGRNTHLEDECYAKTTISGEKIVKTPVEQPLLNIEEVEHLSPAEQPLLNIEQVEHLSPVDTVEYLLPAEEAPHKVIDTINKDQQSCTIS